jgi:hypothetical protein
MKNIASRLLFGIFSAVVVTSLGSAQNAVTAWN